MNSIIQLSRELWLNKGLIWDLAKNDFKTRYAGSVFGITWAFVQPIITIIVFWYVFQIGFKAVPVQNFPFICWLAAGLVPWFYFSDAWASAGNSFFEYSYLVKKVVFKVSMLPLIKIVSSVFIHAVFIIFLIFMYAWYGYYPKITYLQLLYYSFCMIVLTIALAFMTASITPFFKDLNNIIGIILQFGMWLTPIMWQYTTIDKEYRYILYLNPMYYIVEGYRDSLINNVWFWERYDETAAFWGIIYILIFFGTFFYKNLRPHFADVL